MDIELQDAQSEWFWSEATEVLLGGAAGGGKSFFLRADVIYWAFEIPGLQIYFFRRIFPDLEANHINHPLGFPTILAPHMANKEVKYNSSKGAFQFSNGSRINLCHVQHEKDMFKYQGAEIHMLVIDELTHFTEKIYRFLRGRVRMSGVPIDDKYKDLFPRIVTSSNPGGIGHNWVKMTFVDFAPPKTVKRADKKEGGMLRAYYPATLKDNAKLLEDDPDYADRLEGLGSDDLVRAMLEGDWDIVAGGAIDDVWQRKTHVILPFEIPKTWRVDRGYDWGSSKPAACIWFAESNGEEVTLHDGSVKSFKRGTVFAIREKYFWNGRADEGSKLLATEHAEMIKEIDTQFKDKNIRVKDGPADNAIYDSQNGSCIADDMKKEKITWTRSDKSPGSRKQGLEKLRTMLKAALQSIMEEPGFYVFDTCTQIIRTLPTLPRDEKNTEDVDTKAEDHLYDVIRYRLTAPRIAPPVTQRRK